MTTLMARSAAIFAIAGVIRFCARTGYGHRRDIDKSTDRFCPSAPAAVWDGYVRH